MFIRILFFILIISTLFSCGKNVVNSKAPPGARISALIGSTWVMRSATSIDSLSTGTLHRYKGTIADSLDFLWNLGPNVNVTGIFSSMNGTIVQSDIIKLSYAGGISMADTSTIAYDTIVCSTKIRPNYSDTLFITKVSRETFVFKIRYADAFGKGVEMDTLYRYRDH